MALDECSVLFPEPFIFTNLRLHSLRVLKGIYLTSHPHPPMPFQILILLNLLNQIQQLETLVKSWLTLVKSHAFLNLFLGHSSTYFVVVSPLP